MNQTESIVCLLVYDILRKRERERAVIMAMFIIVC